MTLATLPHQDLHRRLAVCIPLNRIITVSWLQPRCSLDPATVAEYADLYRTDGPQAMEPITCWIPPEDLRDPDDLPDSVVLTRGFTRLEAARQAGLTEISALIYDSPAADPATAARLLLCDSLGGNKHGQRLTTADKRRALALYHGRIDPDAWASTREVAGLIGCSHEMVSAYRRERQYLPPSLIAEHAALLLQHCRRQDEPPPPAPKARILAALWAHHQANGPDAPLSRESLQAAAGAPLDVHPGQLAKAGHISGSHAGGYRLTQSMAEFMTAATADPLRPRNLSTALIDLVEDQDDEPLDVANAAAELGTDSATILSLASTTPGLRVTEREVGSERVPAIELHPPAQAAGDDDDDDEDAPYPGPYHPDPNPHINARNRALWLIDQARPQIARRTSLSLYQAHAVAVVLGLSADAQTVDLSSPASVEDAIIRFALDALIEATTGPADYEIRWLPRLLAAIGPQLGLDWPALEAAAAARFDAAPEGGGS